MNLIIYLINENHYNPTIDSIYGLTPSLIRWGFLFYTFGVFYFTDYKFNIVYIYWYGN